MEQLMPVRKKHSISYESVPNCLYKIGKTDALNRRIKELWEERLLLRDSYTSGYHFLSKRHCTRISMRSVSRGRDIGKKVSGKMKRARDSGCHLKRLRTSRIR